MPKYVIEREIPGAGSLSKDQLQAISQKSCGVLNELGPQIQWIEASSPMIASIAFTSPQMRNSFASMRSKADSRQIAFPR